MKRIIFSLILFVFGNLGFSQVIQVNNSLTAQQLVQNVLLGNGVTASNITYNGYANAIGSFVGTGTNIGLNGGILLTTGDLNSAVGPNSQSGYTGFGSGGNGTGAGDNDISTLTANSTYDAAVLEFDFVPVSDTLKFNYVFASEEYMEYVGFGVNDGFGFFITGPGIPGTVNLATIPTTPTPTVVTIDNVNAFSNSAYYVDNGDGSNPFANPSVQYDGFTKVLTAVTPVICGQTYHIKIAIADAGDGSLDSGVFLEAGSFSASGGLQLSSAVQYGTIQNQLIEGCGGAIVGVKRLGDISQAETISYTVTGTATSGTDFTTLPGSVSFAAGQDSTTIPVDALYDGLAEGSETITLTVSYTNNCGVVTTSSIDLTIVDATPIVVNAGPDELRDCQTLNNNIILNATATGGVQPLTFSWNNGTTGPSYNGPTNGLTTFIVSVTDQCSTMVATDTLSVIITGANPLSLLTSNDTLVCAGESVNLLAQAIGGNGGLQYTWSTGATSNAISVTPLNTTTYNVQVTDNCGIVAQESVTVQAENVDANFSYNFTSVEAEVEFTNLSSPNAVSYVWDFGNGDTSTLRDPKYVYNDGGSYDVTLTTVSPNGCIDVRTLTVIVRVDYTFFIPNTFTPTDDGLNDIFTVKGRGFTDFKMRIFDRWGRELYFTNDPSKGWDGRNNTLNTFYPQGIYTYRIDVVDGNLLERTYRGQVNLLR